MKISGFSIIRNGTRFDYPYLESYRSLLSVVDELIINVGMGEDDTLQQIQKFAQIEGSGKISIFETDWQIDRSQNRRGGIVLSEQTNLALQKCSNDWCFYLQADEVLHESETALIRAVAEKSLLHPEIEGLLFDYVHFYGSFDVIQKSRSSYRREVRMIRKSSGAKSVGDAQSFRKADGSKLAVIPTGAHIFHYGWVRTPEAMKEKTFHFDQLYHGDPTPEDAKSGTPHTGDNYKYKRIWGLQPFRGTHPSVMSNRIKNKGWQWDLKKSPWSYSWKDIKRIFLDGIEILTGYRLFEYRSYRKLRTKIHG